MAHYWADFDATKRSYELIARYVMPRFQAQLSAREDALNWAKEMHPQLEREASPGGCSRSGKNMRPAVDGKYFADPGAAF